MKSQRNVGNVHQQNILDSLQHRLDAARAKGDANLISQLEREMQQSRGMASAPLPRTQAPRVSNAEVTRQHRQNLRDNVQRRLNSARDRGDQNLINQLERELQELA
ncbi:hypothetical protein H6F67_11230 [Microcoleus sp. FACHB-1515]|uniref:arginine synthesis PII-interacting regulator PirA n=1 Tax=Cyanophyceae TaxID=3028117 RepID=UPI00168871F0|nr:hypothetical protein [Microcoleus sp. FACHB-1515]MBD2090427.1 hypothetical protein [Microcoleus sp. FACHB-1515]